MSDRTIIDLKGIYVTQDGHAVLSDVNLSIEKGEFVFLIGQTGSGKSSLLKTLYGELGIQTGEGTVSGYSLHNLKEKDIPFLRRKLGIVFQDFQLLTDRSILDNLLFVMKATGWDDTNLINSRIDEVLTEVGLSPDKKHKMPHQLSGGEQQRVVIARAMVNHPEVILADEPTGNLDPDSSTEIMGLLLKISRLGTAVIMATHDYRMIEKFPSRIIKCENGKIVEDLFNHVH